MTPIDIRPDHLRMVREVLHRHLPARVKVWVFGSRASWTTKDSSDLDLALDGETEIPRRSLSALEVAFEDSDLPYTVDVVDLQRVGERFRRIVTKQRAPLPESERPRSTDYVALEALPQPRRTALSARLPRRRRPMNDEPRAATPPIDYEKFRLSLKRLEEQHANYRNPAASRPRLDEEGVAESVVQRFETCYDCLWKVLKRYLNEVLGVPDPPNSPNPIFRLAHQNHLFRTPVDQWLLYTQRRNDTAHDYDGEKAQAALDVMADFIDDAIGLYQTMSGEPWE